MPLYEFLRLAIEKLESSQQKKCSVDLSSEVTENGQITAPSVCDDAALENSVTGRIENSGGVEYIFNGISPELPYGDQLDLSRKDETVPWLSYPVDGNLQDYSSSVSAKKVLAVNSVMPRQNGSSFDETVGDLDAVKLSCMKAHQLHPWMHHKEDICNCQYATFVSSGKGRDLVSDSSCMKMESCHTSLLVNSRKILAKEPTEMFVDGKSKKITLQNKSNGVESIAAVSSSVSSGNSADERVAHEHHNTKRKFSDIEESECQSDKSSPAQGGHGLRKSRAAEVHNLSERRRRDRINEKMRALQELIPNCNKADKASMLDEAIEYLKNLKHQVQMMALGSGLCVPPVMFPPGSRHMYHAPIPHFSYMGMRMGMGMGMMNSGFQNPGGGSPLCPVIPILPVPGHPGPGAHFVPHGWHQTSALRTVLSHNGVPTKPSNKNVLNVEAS